MLVISRTVGESLLIGEAAVSVLKVGGKSVSIGIQAPQEIKVIRGEIIGSGRELLPFEDRRTDAVFRRLRAMSAVRREFIIRQIVQEFCSPRQRTPISAGV